MSNRITEAELSAMKNHSFTWPGTNWHPDAVVRWARAALKSQALAQKIVDAANAKAGSAKVTGAKAAK